MRPGAAAAAAGGVETLAVAVVLEAMKVTGATAGGTRGHGLGAIPDVDGLSPKVRPKGGEVKILWGERALLRIEEAFSPLKKPPSSWLGAHRGRRRINALGIYPKSSAFH